MNGTSPRALVRPLLLAAAMYAQVVLLTFAVNLMLPVLSVGDLQYYVTAVYAELRQLFVIAGGVFLALAALKIWGVDCPTPRFASSKGIKVPFLVLCCALLLLGIVLKFPPGSLQASSLQEAAIFGPTGIEFFFAQLRFPLGEISSAACAVLFALWLALRFDLIGQQRPTSTANSEIDS
ncbi:MAG: hypothetical protein Q4C87_00560 [Actinomycetaceae bacterium]|nr:hypothetical protein [Actinomycetaceae bacterium]